MTSRRSTAAMGLFLCMAVITSTVFFALRADGREGTESTTNDGGAWLVNQRAGSIGHVNRQVKELSSAVRVSQPTGDFDVYQPDDAIIAHDRVTDSLEVVDMRTHLRSNTVAVPGNAEIVKYDDGLVISAAQPFRVWQLTGGALAEVQSLESSTPLYEGPAGALGVSANGQLLIADPETGELVRSSAAMLSRLATPSALALIDEIVFDGDNALVRSGDRLALVVGDDVSMLDGRARPWSVVGRPTLEPTGSIVAVNDQNEVIRVSMRTGATSILGSLGAEDPVPPIEHLGCVHALSNRPAQYWVSCGDDAPRITELTSLGRADLRLRLVNGWIWINDLASGNLWTVDQDQELSLIDDWGAVLPLESSDDPDDDTSSDGDDDIVDDVENPDAEDAQTIEADEFDEDGINQPPVAFDDDGHQTHMERPIVINVIGNDEDPDNDVILVSSVENLSGTDAIIGRTIDGTSIQVSPAPGFTGTLRFSYTITDGRGGSDSASGDVTVDRRTGEQNEPPVAVTDITSVTAGEKALIDVLTNDFDPDGDSLVVVGAQAPSGSISFDPAGRLIFEPDSISEEGELELTYTIVDDFGEQAVGRVRVSIRLKDSNQPPDARNDGAVTVVSQPATINLLANDTDPDGDDLFVAQRPVLLSPPGLEVFTTITPDGEFVFIPDTAGTFVFSYAASDDEDSDLAQIRVEVSDVSENRPPIAVRDDAVIPFGESRIVYALANDGDPDGDVVGIVDLNVAAGSGLRVEQFADIGFRVFVEATGPARRTFRYSISDGIADPVEAVVVVAIANAETQNQAPVAQGDTVEVRPGSSVVVPVLNNDFDPEGGPLQVAGVSIVGGGTAEPGPGGQSVRVTVNPDTTTSFSVSYDVTDDQGNRTAAVIRVRVVPNGEPNRPPVARPDSARTPFETELRVRVTANDSDPDGDTIRVESIADQPLNGVAEVDLATGEVIYIPGDGYAGTDRFSYTVVDAFGASTEGEVLVGVMPKPALNQDPIATDDSFITVATGVLTELTVLTNDSDPDGDQIRVREVGVSAVGSVEVSLDRTTILFLAPTEQDTDESVTFEYTITDGQGGQASALITVLVQATPPRPDGAPTAVDDAVGPVAPGAEVRIDVVTNDDDPDAPESDLVVSVFDSELLVDGQVVTLIAPDESAEFSYQITDANGHSDTAVITVAVANPKPPVAIDDQAGPVKQGDEVVVDVLANDLDEDGPVEELELVSVSGAGARIDDGVVRIVAPEASTQFTYTIRDATGLEASAIISLIVTQNRAPIVTPGVFETPFEETVELDLAPLAVDPDNDTLSYSCCQTARNGSPQVLNAGDGVLLVAFTPDDGFSGDAVLTFEADDRFGHAVSGSVTITVGEQPNRVPTTVDGAAELQVPRAEGPPISTLIDLSTLSFDPDPDDVLTWTSQGEPGLGLTARIDGSALEITATDSSDAGTTSLQWTVTDAEGESATASIAITVLDPQNDPPVATATNITVPAGNSVVTNLADLTTDDDADEVLAWEIVANPPTGITITQTGTSAVTIAAAVNVSGTSAAFDYTVTDRLGESANAQVTIEVGDPDQPLPEARDDSADTIQDQAVTVDVLTNDIDPIGQGLTITNPGGSGDGTVTANGSTIEFLPNPTFFGTTSFTYTIRDAADIATREASANVSIEVTGRPSAPVAPACTPESRVATLTWTAPANNGAPITGYLIEHDQAGTDTLGVTTNHQWTALTNGTEYRFRLAAENIAGTGAFSDWSIPCTPDIEPERPAPPQVSHGDGWLEVTWTEPVNDGSEITEYELRIGGGSVQTSTDTFLRWTGLDNGTDYTFQVAARNAKGLSDFSTASTPEHPSTIPSAPVIATTTRAGLVGAQASGILQVNWTPVPVSQDGGDTITEYRVERAQGPSAIANGANADNYVWSGLQNGTSHEFRVYAINRDGESPPSAWSPATAACTVPDGPTNVSAVRGDSEATVTYAAPNNDGGCNVTSYDIRVSSGTGGSGISSTNPGTVRIDTLTNGTTYAFEVRANNVIGSGPWVTTNSVVPAGLPICGGNYRLDTIDLTGATFTWTVANLNGGGPAANNQPYEMNINSGGWGSAGTDGHHIIELTSSTSYTVRMRAWNDVGNTDCGDVTFTSCPSVPDAPGTPTISANQTNNSITTTWSTVSVGCTSQPQVTGDFDIDRYEVDPDPGSPTGEGLSTSKTYSSLSPGDSLRVRVRACYASACGSWSPWSDVAEIDALGTVSISIGSARNYQPGYTTGLGSPCFPAQGILDLGADPNQGCYNVRVVLSGWQGNQEIHCYRTTNPTEGPWNGEWAYYGGAVLGNGSHDICSYTQAGRAVAVVVNGSLSGQPGRTINISPPAVASTMIDPWPTN